MKNKNIWVYGFNWGSIIGGSLLVLNVLGFFLGFMDSFLWGLLTSLVFIFGMVWTITNYKKNIIKTDMKFSRLFLLGMISAFIISFFHMLYMMIFVYKLNPTYFDDFLVLYQDILNSMKFDLVLEDEPDMVRAIERALIPSFFIANFIGNLFYVLLISILISFQKQVIPTPNPNQDYTPYQNSENNEQEDLEEEEEEEEDEEDESEEEDKK